MVMTDQTKTPGAMVPVERELLAVVEGYISSQADAFPLINVPRGMRSEALDTVSSELRAILAAPADHIEDARAMVEQTPAAGGEPARKWPKITQPAKVGGTRFSVGCSAQSVIECAYRLYEYEVTPEKEAERCKRADDVRDGLLASALEVPRLNAVIGQLNERIAELEAGIAKANDWSHLRPDMDPQKP
jgi:hypothetical protein